MKKLLILLLHIIIYLFVILMAFQKVVILDSWTKTIAILSILLLLSQLITYSILKFKLWSFSVWFVTLSHIFMFGRIYLNAFSLDKDIFWNLIVRYNPEIMLSTAYFLLVCIQTIFLISITFDPIRLKKREIHLEKESDISLYYTGVLLLVISIPVKFLVDIRQVLSARSIGVYDSASSSSGLLIHISMLILPGILAVLFSEVLSKKKMRWLIIVFSSYLLIPMILTGDRRYSVIMLLTVALAYLKRYQIKLNFKILIPLAYLTMIFLNFLMVVRNNRLEGFSGIFDFLLNNYASIFLGTDFIYQTLSEFGLSFFSVVNVFMYIPEQIDYYWGYTFIAMIPTILPIGWAFPDFFAKASLSNVINPKIGYPVGATLFGDLYGNFGYFGGVLMIAIIFSGMLKLLKIKEHNTRLNSAIYFSAFFIFINLIRATPFEMFRPLFMYLVLLNIIYWAFNLKRKGS